MPSPNILLQKTMPTVNPETEYGGQYADVMEGEWLILMRKVLENKITNKDHIKQIKDGFNEEFGPAVLNSLKEDIAATQ
tara:strand:+ start:658 stop:894 length:237 start_codon:yes stop_codon:yes gene_type:complete